MFTNAELENRQGKERRGHEKERIFRRKRNSKRTEREKTQSLLIEFSVLKSKIDFRN